MSAIDYDALEARSNEERRMYCHVMQLQLRTLGAHATGVFIDEDAGGYIAEIRTPDGEDPDEYLCFLEAAWADAHPAIKMEFRNVERPPYPRTWLGATQVHSKPDGSVWATSKEPLTAAVLEAAAAKLRGMVASIKDHIDNPPVSKHLLHAKGPRNKWGGAKGARIR